MDITSEQDLQKISSTEETFKLENDITVSKNFETIEEFNGTLDGQGHKIYNLTSTFIETLGEGSMIKNLTFKKVELENEIGLFYENNGEIQSISVKNVNVENLDIEDIYNFGVIVKENYGKIEDCTVRDADINTDMRFGTITGLNGDGSIIDCSVSNVTIKGDSNAGGICGEEEDGSIIDCSVSNVTIKRGSNAGGICGESESGSIKGCTVKNSNVLGSNAIGGILGRSKNDKYVRDCSVKNSEIECEFLDCGGIIGRVRTQDAEEIHIQDCVIEDTDILGLRTAYLIADSDCRSTGCSVINCSATHLSTDENTGLYLFTNVSEESFITDTVVKGNVEISNDTEKITNSYADVKIISESPVTISVDSNSFYTNVDHQKPPTKKTVEVSEVEDFKKIDQFDTVELCDNIDFSEGDFEKIEKFSGVFNGNGHTLSNLSKPVFNLFTGGSIKNVCVDEYCITKYFRSGCISKYCNEATFENVKIIKSNSVSEETKITPLAHDVRNSRIQKYSASLDLSSDVVYGLSHELDQSVIQDCTVDLDVTIGSEGGSLASDADSKIYNFTTTGKVLMNKESCSFYGVCENVRGKAVNCSSDLDIYTAKNVSDFQEISGLFGNVTQVKNCEFTGEIKTLGEIKGESSYILGRGVSGIATSCKRKGKIQNCVNKGNITVASKKALSVGGIAVVNQGEIKNCINEGDISGGSTTGGITGELKDGIIDSSRNLGNIEQANTCGGLVGLVRRQSSSGVVKNCYNYAEIDSNDVLIGTIQEDSTSTTIENLLYIPVDDTQKSQYGEETTENPENLNVILF